MLKEEYTKAHPVGYRFTSRLHDTWRWRQSYEKKCSSPARRGVLFKKGVCYYPDVFMHRVWQAWVCMVHLIVKVVPLGILAQEDL